MTLFREYKAKLELEIEKLTSKLNNDKSLTEGQYKAIKGVLYRKIEALKENRVF